MRLTVLILAALILPFVWGYAVYWVMERLWPRRTGGQSPHDGQGDPLPDPPDYQI